MRKLIYTVIVFFVSKTSYPQNDIFMCILKGSVEEVMQTVKENADAVHQTTKEGITPLLLACQRGNIEVASYLLELAVDLDYVSEIGTALMVCATKGNDSIAKLLLDKKANPNIRDADGNTALIYAVQFKHIALVELLLSYHADLEIRDNLGKTAFEYAAFSNETALVDLLK